MLAILNVGNREKIGPIGRPLGTSLPSHGRTEPQSDSVGYVRFVQTLDYGAIDLLLSSHLHPLARTIDNEQRAKDVYVLIHVSKFFTKFGRSNRAMAFVVSVFVALGLLRHQDAGVLVKANAS